jgi:hypothetical protein
MNVTGGSTDVTTYFVLRTAADGVEATGLTITNFDLQYVRTGAAPSAKVDATALAATDSAHTDNKAIEIDATDAPGLYRVDWPDACFAAGAKQVILTVKCATCFTEHLAVDIDPPVNLTKILTTAVSTPATAGILDVNVKNMNNVAATSITTINANQGTTQPINFTGSGASAYAKTDVTDWKTAAAPAMTGDAYARLGAAGAGLSAIPWNGSWDTEVQSECADALTAYDPPTRAEATSDKEAIQTDIAAVPTVTEIQAEMEENGASILDTLRDDLADGGRLDLLVDAIKAKTDNLPTDPADESSLESAITTAHSTTDALIGGLNNLAAGDVTTACTSSLNTYDPPTKAELDAAVADVSVDEIQPTAIADLFNTDSLTTYAAAVSGSAVKEIADNAGGSALTEDGIATATVAKMFDTDSGETYASAVSGSPVKEIADNAASGGGDATATNQTTIIGKLDTIQADLDNPSQYQGGALRI